MLEARSNSGQPTRLVDEEPELLEDAAPYWEAFQELHGQRDTGFGVGEIRRQAVTDFLNERGIEDPTEREAYRHYLRVVDREYLAGAAERMEKKSTPSPKGGSRQTLKGPGR